MERARMEDYGNSGNRHGIYLFGVQFGLRQEKGFVMLIYELCTLLYSQRKSMKSLSGSHLIRFIEEMFGNVKGGLEQGRDGQKENQVEVSYHYQRNIQHILIFKTDPMDKSITKRLRV